MRILPVPAAAAPATTIARDAARAGRGPGRRLAAIVVLVSGALLTAPAHAEEEGNGGLVMDPVEMDAPPAEPAPGAGPDAGPARAPGAYAGVVPGRAGGPTRRRPKQPSITWIGYQPKGGGAARLFVESSVPIVHEESTQGDVVTVTIPGVRLAQRNVGRRLDLSAFEGPIASVDVKQTRGRAAGVTLRVKLRAGTRQPAVMTEPDPSGYHFLFLDFGL